MTVDMTLLLAFIGVLGIGSQWLAWRLQMPAIVLMLLAGFLVGPVFQLFNPDAIFGDLKSPLIALAVAVILFEGGMTLKLSHLRDAGPAVRRLIFPGAFIGWGLSTLAARYGGGLSWESSIVFGGILVVTGPTVISPLLRQAKLASRPAAILRWESIVVDPIGALFAVLAYEIFATLSHSDSLIVAMGHLSFGLVFSSLIGIFFGKGIVFAFEHGQVPEFLKIPVLLVGVVLSYAISDLVLHESGLLAVTLMGMVIANSKLPSLGELRRFKEHVTILLVSAVFILLAASVGRDVLTLLGWKTFLFVFLIIFMVRPLTIFLSLIGINLPLKEKLMVGFVGPRGVVAVAVSGLFGEKLVALGVEDAVYLAPTAFALVTVSVIFHGFTISPLARFLGLASAGQPGVLLVGASQWSQNLAAALKEAGLPVLLSDRNFFRLRGARQSGLPVFWGEILSEAAEHRVAFEQYDILIALTDNDDYNALICTDFGPELGRSNVYQLGRHRLENDEKAMFFTLGGHNFALGMDYSDISTLFREGWRFSVTTLSEEYGIDKFIENQSDAKIFAAIREGKALSVLSPKTKFSFAPSDKVLYFGPPKRQKVR